MLSMQLGKLEDLFRRGIDSETGNGSDQFIGVASPH